MMLPRLRDWCTEELPSAMITGHTASFPSARPTSLPNKFEPAAKPNPLNAARLMAELSLGQQQARFASTTTSPSAESDELFNGTTSSLGVVPDHVRALKKARRREQCRVNQANYRKRKRAFEMQVEGQITTLRNEIDMLTAHRDALLDMGNTDNSLPTPEEAVDAIYTALNEQYVDMNRHHHFGSSMFELQAEEFPTLRHFMERWRHYRAHFQAFHLRLLSIQRVAVGTQFVVRVAAELQCVVPRGPLQDQQLVCPVMQHFTFDPHHAEPVAILSQVDWIAGMAHQSLPPQHIALVLGAMH